MVARDLMKEFTQWVASELTTQETQETQFICFYKDGWFGCEFYVMREGKQFGAERVACRPAIAVGTVSREVVREMVKEALEAIQVAVDA